ncbi:MAG: heme exporter protein CcmB [Pseudomonadota bacterium]
MTGLSALFVNEIKLAVKSGGSAMTGVIFFLSLVTIVPFAIGPDLELLSRIGPAILWIGTLLATLLGLDRLFRNDVEDGTFDLHRLSGEPLELIVFVKGVAHFVTTALPLVVSAPLFGLFLNMDGDAILATALTLLIGSPALTFLGAIGAALTVGLSRGGLLLPILILPLTIPVLIFGVAASYAYTDPLLGFRTPVLLLGAMTLFSLVLSPIASAWALRLNSD